MALTCHIMLVTMCHDDTVVLQGNCIGAYQWLPPVIMLVTMCHDDTVVLKVTV